MILVKEVKKQRVIIRGMSELVLSKIGDTVQVTFMNMLYCRIHYNKIQN